MQNVFHELSLSATETRKHKVARLQLKYNQNAANVNFSSRRLTFEQFELDVE